MNQQGFHNVALSLKQFRRADLREFAAQLGDNPVDAIYVDPLPNNAILNTVLAPTTTFLLGRKGTGKSTVFARAQSELRNRHDLISAYVDVKALAELMDPGVATQAPEASGLTPDLIAEHLLKKGFLRQIVRELIAEIENVCERRSLWQKITGKGKKALAVKPELERLRTELGTNTLREEEIPVLQKVLVKREVRTGTETEDKVTAEVKGQISVAGATAGGSVGAGTLEKSLEDNKLYEEYSRVVMQVLPFRELIETISTLLEEADLKHVYAFFDDFSELSPYEQRLFVDVILTPLNNASNNRFKLKVAGYPGRVYLGRIDPSKIDLITLDFSSLYEAAEVQEMEKTAINYAERLILTRFRQFNVDFDEHFDQHYSREDYFRLLFEASFNVPRTMGALLDYCYRDRIAKGESINPQAIRLAARKHYETVQLAYFDTFSRFALEPFSNKLDRSNQQALLEMLASEARQVRRGIAEKKIGGTYFDGLSNPPVSHFLVSRTLEPMLVALEANFFISRYKHTRDKDGKDAIVFALSYGLVEAARLSWGYPPGREYRNYFVQRCFDYSKAIEGFLASKQTIRCDECGTSFPLEKRESFEFFKWHCPECRVGTCRIVYISSELTPEISAVRADQRLPPVELDIILTLGQEERAMRAGEIGALIDAAHQLVGHRTSKLRDLGLIDKRADGEGNQRSALTERAKALYLGRS